MIPDFENELLINSLLFRVSKNVVFQISNFGTFWRFSYGIVLIGSFC